MLYYHVAVRKGTLVGWRIRPGRSIRDCERTQNESALEFNGRYEIAGGKGGVKRPGVHGHPFVDGGGEAMHGGVEKDRGTVQRVGIDRALGGKSMSCQECGKNQMGCFALYKNKQKISDLQVYAVYWVRIESRARDKMLGECTLINEDESLAVESRTSSAVSSGFTTFLYIVLLSVCLQTHNLPSVTPST